VAERLSVDNAPAASYQDDRAGCLPSPYRLAHGLIYIIEPLRGHSYGFGPGQLEPLTRHDHGR
jgi:hypothetical protein